MRDVDAFLAERSLLVHSLVAWMVIEETRRDAVLCLLAGDDWLRAAALGPRVVPFFVPCMHCIASASAYVFLACSYSDGYLSFVAN